MSLLANIPELPGAISRTEKKKLVRHPRGPYKGRTDYTRGRSKCTRIIEVKTRTRLEYNRQRRLTRNFQNSPSFTPLRFYKRKKQPYKKYPRSGDPRPIKSLIKTNRSGYIGVCFSLQKIGRDKKRFWGKWDAKVECYGLRRHIGYYADPKIAAIAHDVYILEIIRPLGGKNITNVELGILKPSDVIPSLITPGLLLAPVIDSPPHIPLPEPHIDDFDWDKFEEYLHTDLINDSDPLILQDVI